MTVGKPIVPWSFLADYSVSKKPSYASLVSQVENHNHPLISIADLPSPTIKGGLVSIQVSEESYQRGLESCKYNLVGRLLLSKGTKPLTTHDLRMHLQKEWSLQSWTIIPMGKGFFVFQFKSMDALQKVWSNGAISLQPGMLRLYQWSPDFSPATFKSTTAQLWVRLWDLGLQFWDPTTLFEIAGSIGTPIRIDPATLNKSIGLYARVLIEVDLASDPPIEILVERVNGDSLLIGLEYEKFPNICSGCGAIGHLLQNFRFHHDEPEQVKMRGRSRSRHRRKKSRVTSRYVPKDKP